MASIRSIEVLRATLPRRAPFEISRGTFVAARRVFVRMTLDDGAIGFGECGTLEGDGAKGRVAVYSEETQDSSYAVLATQIGPALGGLDAYNIADVHRVMGEVTLMNPQARAAVDIALHDAVGRSLGVPAHVLLGGAYRDRIPLAQSVGVRTDDEVIEGARKVVEAGYHVVKLKGGRDIREDVRRIGLIRRAVGEGVAIRLDANAGYRAYDEVILHLARAQDAGLDELEQPLGRFDLQGMQRLAADLLTPVIADESVFFAHDAMELIRRNGADVLNIKVQKAGGLLPAIRIDHIASAAKVGVLIGAVQETGIGTAASLQLAAACRDIGYASDCRTHLVFEHSLLREALDVRDGDIRVPQGPGLGVDVDVAALERYAEGPWTTITR